MDAPCLNRAIKARRNNKKKPIKRGVRTARISTRQKSINEIESAGEEPDEKLRFNLLTEKVDEEP